VSDRHREGRAPSLSLAYCPVSVSAREREKFLETYVALPAERDWICTVGAVLHPCSS